MESGTQIRGTRQFSLGGLDALCSAPGVRLAAPGHPEMFSGQGSCLKLYFSPPESLGQI